MLSASIDIIYSVHVVLLVLFAERRNFPFSTSRAAGRNTVISPEQVPKTMIARNIKLLNAYIYIYSILEQQDICQLKIRKYLCQHRKHLNQ